MARLALKSVSIAALLWALGPATLPIAYAQAPAPAPVDQAADQARPVLSASELHRDGAYDAAIEKGRAEATAQGLIAAAKSALFLAAYEQTDKDQALRLLAEATRDAEAAVEKAPENIDANLQLSIAIGYKARIKTSRSLAKDARERAEKLTEIAPENGYVLGLLGGWHGEAIGAYGKLIAKVAVGAKTQDFETYFDKAVQAAPNNALIVAYYARLLLDINDDGMAQKAEALLSDIDTATPANAFERYMKERALELKAAIEADDKAALKKLIKSQRAFRNLK